MTLTATRETGTVRPTSSPTLRFLGGVGMMVLQFFGGLVSVLLATILGALVIGLGGLYDEGLSLGANAGLILGLAGLAWISFRRRAWMLLWGGITAAALEWPFFAYIAHEYMKAPI